MWYAFKSYANLYFETVKKKLLFNYYSDITNYYCSDTFLLTGVTHEYLQLRSCRRWVKINIIAVSHALSKIRLCLLPDWSDHLISTRNMDSDIQFNQIKHLNQNGVNTKFYNSTEVTNIYTQTDSDHILVLLGSHGTFIFA